MKHANEWLKDVGEFTSEHRADKAEKLERRGRNRVFARRLEGFSEPYAHGDGQWHRARARGQRERINRVEACGAKVIQVSCVGCKKKRELRLGCRIPLLCVPCRKVIAAEKRAKFHRARNAAVADASRRGLLIASNYRRWSEKFLTLTAPHFRHQSVAERIRVVLDAWGLFLRKLNDYFAERDASFAEFFRVFEWEPGDDGRGHPHLHIWLLSPYLPRDELQRWWGEALADVTGDAASLRAVIDIREVSGRDVEQELIKYLTKDITSDGAKLAPKLYAEVYKALDDRRSTQASRGFMARANALKNVCECGCALPKQVRVLPPTDEKPEGSP